MTKHFTAVLLLTVILLLLCGCFPLAEKEFTLVNGAVTDNTDNGNDDNPSASTRLIYVSGAVKNDGYVSIPEICDYSTLLCVADVCEQAALPKYPFSTVSPDLTEYFADYVYDGVVCYSVNVNGIIVTSRLGAYGLTTDVVDKLADYIERNGKITNRNILKSVLGDDYEDNYYKFFIDRCDYA